MKNVNPPSLNFSFLTESFALGFLSEQTGAGEREFA